MRKSNLKILSFVILATQLILVACSPEKPKSIDRYKGDATAQQESQATFKVKSISGDSEPVAYHKDFGFTDQKRFYFNSCIIDSKGSPIRSGFEFEITTATEPIKVKSDDKGCLSWSEDFKYSPLNDSQFLPVAREITGKGFHKGTANLVIGINPWNHEKTNTTVIDLRMTQPNKLASEESVQSLMAGMDIKTQSQNLKTFQIDDLRITTNLIQTTTAGSEIEIDLRTQPFVKVKGMTSDNILLPLSRGPVTLELTLINTYNKVIRQLNTKPIIQKIQIESGYLKSQSRILIPTLPKVGQLLLGVRVSPATESEILKPFEGLYIIGSHNSLIGSYFSRIKTESTVAGFSLEAYLNSGEKTTEGTIQARYEMDPLKITYLGVKNETQAQKTIEFNVSACFKNNMDSSSLIGHIIEVTKINGDTESVKTLSNGCINWTDSVLQDVWKEQKRIIKKVHIKNKTVGLDQSIQVLLNPWDHGDGFARDEKNVSSKEFESAQKNTDSKFKSQMFLKYYAATLVDYKYEMDGFLNPIHKKTFRFGIEPRVLRYSSITQGREDEDELRTGYYLLKMAIAEKDYVKTELNPLDHFEQIVEVKGGRIVVDVPFRLKEFVLFKSRLNILMEIHPIDEKQITEQNGKLQTKNNQPVRSIILKDTGLISPTYAGVFFFGGDGDMKDLYPYNTEALHNQLIDPNKKIETQNITILEKLEADLKHKQVVYRDSSEKLSEKSTYAQINHLDYINLKKVTNEELSQDLSFKVKNSNRVFVNDYKTILNQVIQTGVINKELATRFCQLWFNKFIPEQNDFYNSEGTIYLKNECLRHIQYDLNHIFVVDRIIFNNKLSPQVAVHKVGYKEVYSVGTNFSLSKDFNRSKAEVISATVQANINGKLGDFGLLESTLKFFGVGASVSYSINKSKSSTDGQANNLAINSQLSLNVEPNHFQIKLENYEQCAIIRLKSGLFETMGPQHKKSMINPIELRKLKKRGLLFCTGIAETKTKIVQENVYSIYQESDRLTQDGAQIENRPFTFALRGDADFYNFMVAIKAQAVRPHNAEADQNGGIDPILIMKNLNISDHATSSYPGVYHLLPENYQYKLSRNPNDLTPNQL